MDFSNFFFTQEANIDTCSGVCPPLSPFLKKNCLVPLSCNLERIVDMQVPEYMFKLKIQLTLS